MTTIKSITARRIVAEHPEVKEMLWGGSFWSSGYFVSSVEKSGSENAIRGVWAQSRKGKRVQATISKFFRARLR